MLEIDITMVYFASPVALMKFGTVKAKGQIARVQSKQALLALTAKVLPSKERL